MKRLATLTCLLLLTACAHGSHGCVTDAAAEGDAFETCDPWRPVNEPIFTFNLAADRYVIGPVAHTYHEAPDWTRATVDNFLTNLGEPLNVINGTLQGDMQGAGTSLWRFILNTTFGFAGLRDFAGENGLKYQDQSFDKTLASWDVAEGPYVVLPLLGPSTVRGTTGYVVDWVMDPVGWLLSTPEDIAQTVADGIVTRDEQDGVIQGLYYDSIEPYSATRAAYLQHEEGIQP